MSGYAELAVTSNFSFLRGASQPEELVKQACALGLRGLGIADRNSVAGVVRIHVAAKALKEDPELNEDPEIKERLAHFDIAVGARLVFDDGTTPDILAYPKDRAAWGRLTRLAVSRQTAGREGRVPPWLAGSPRIYRRAQSHRDAAGESRGRYAFACAGTLKERGVAPTRSGSRAVFCIAATMRGGWRNCPTLPRARACH